MPVRYNLIKKRAAELLARANISSPPVDIEQLASISNAEIRYEPYAGTDMSGMLCPKPDGGAIIGVNALHAATRKRFTIAHELGHLTLHDDQKLHVDDRFPIAFRNEISSLATDDEEIEANQFAAEILMPFQFLRQDLENLHLDIEDEKEIAKLARRYQVSVQAMTIRLTTLGKLAK